jgi:drug/metabolite transporter (DMT)-like permease
MSLAVAVPFGVSASIVYGTAIVFQHRSASDAGAADTHPKGLLKLLRDPVWVFAVLGDGIGFLLQAVALSTGPVVFIQPLVVLMLPVALLVHWYMGGPRPQRAQWLGSLAIIAGLGLFLCLVGSPGAERIPRSRWVGLAIIAVFLAGVLVSLLSTAFPRRARGALLGVVAGAFYGTVAVMVDDVSELIADRGLSAAFTTPRGLVPIAGILLVGISGIVVTQMSFSLGALGATLPASLAADPLSAVILGAILLREHIPHSPAHAVAYVCSLAAVVVGAVILAAPSTTPVPGHGATSDTA